MTGSAVSFPFPEPVCVRRPAKIFRIRREYNSWVANETLEDYALRYTHAPSVNGRSSRGQHGLRCRVFSGAGGHWRCHCAEPWLQQCEWAILLVGLVTFLTGLPISYYAAKYGVDMDLLTRGAGSATSGPP